MIRVTVDVLTSFILALVAALFLAAIGAFIWAWRGKRVDDHPLCRKCGFDLTGKPETSTQCPECGRDVTTAKAIRVGHRRARRGWLGACGTLLAMFILGGSLAGYVVVKKVNLLQFEPAWWLQTRVMSTNLPARTAAVGELIRRVQGKSLDAARLSATVDQLLDVQGDISRPWDPHWGDLIYEVHIAGLDDARWHRFVRQIPVLTAIARSSARVGAKVPLQCVLRYRAATGDMPVLCIVRAEASVDEPTDSPSTAPSTQPRLPKGGLKDTGAPTDGGMNILLTTRPSAPAGSTVWVKVRGRVRIWDFLGNTWNVLHDYEKDPPVGEQEREFTFSVQIVAEDVVPTTRAAAEVPGWMKVTRFEPSVPSPDPGTYDLVIWVMATKNTVPLAYTARLQRDGVDIGKPRASMGNAWPVGGFVWSQPFSFDIPRGFTGPAQLVLEPSEAAAAATIDIHEYSSAIVRLDVNIGPPPPITPRPTTRRAATRPVATQK